MKQPFHIHIEQNILDDLENRLARTRWIDEIDGAAWNYGTNLSYLKELCDYWQNEFDWRKCERFLNYFTHFTTDINGLQLHFIYEKGKGKHSIPLLLTHGYPDSFIRFIKIIPLLIQADENDVSFDVIVPSIPGYGFSQKPTEPGMNPAAIAELWYKLMTEELGYKNFYAQGGDWGSSITEALAMNHPDALLGIHLTDVPYHHLFTVKPDELSEAEQQYLKRGKQWQMTEGAYAMIQSTKPQTLAYGLNDSPAGLAAWIIEKFWKWSDDNDNIENSFTKDELLMNLTIYWATETINSAVRIYYEAQKNPPKNAEQKIKVPTAVALFPKDLILAPKEFAERFFNIQQWTQMQAGGHFAALEQPQALADDIRKFVYKESNLI